MSKSGKRNLFTALGVVLSFLITIGGWQITKKMLDRKEKALFSVTGSIKIDVPVITPTETNKESDEEAGIKTEYVWPVLSETEIISVLENWENGEYERPHEPTEGQLSMEQAIEAGEAGLSYFYEQEVIPAEFLKHEYDKINAYLCDKQTREQNVQSLDPFYSYWIVTFANENINAILTINAATGQVWKAEIKIIWNADMTSLSSDADTLAVYDTFVSVRINPELALDSFTSYLDLSGGNLLMSDTDKAVKSYADGKLYAVAENRDSASGTSNAYTNIIIFLTTQP